MIVNIHKIWYNNGHLKADIPFWDGYVFIKMQGTKVPDWRKNVKKKLFKMTAAAFCLSCLVSITAFADSSKVVTLGSNLSQEQKDTMFKYFGVEKNAVEVIEVNNTEERQYLEGIASEEVIGTRTYSCSYIEPTTSGGIQVKTANLTWVTSNMIASTLTTAGITNCNVVAACPIEVSGTGALTGILKAYEKASDGTLSEDKKQLATDELIQTGELGDTIGKDKAIQLINGVKMEVIKGEVTSPEEIKGIVEKAASEASVTLTGDQVASLTALMEKIGAQDYDYESLKDTLNRVENNVKDALDNASEEQKNFFSKLWDSIKNFFSNLFDKDENNQESETLAPDNILNNTNDSILGDVVGDATNDQANPSTEGENQETNLETQPAFDTNKETQNETVKSSEFSTNMGETNEETSANDNLTNPADSENQEDQNNTEITSNDNETGMTNGTDQTENSTGSDIETKAENLIDKFINWLKGLFG